MVTSKYELVHRNPLLGLYIFSILISFNNLSERPFTYVFEESIDSIFKDEFLCFTKGVKNYNFTFQNLLKSLPQREKEALRNAAMLRGDKSIKYSSDYIVINRRAFNSRAILKNL
jgi:hypothetical protein